MVFHIQLASYDEIRTEVVEELSNAFKPMEFTLVVRQTTERETLPTIINTKCRVKDETNIGLYTSPHLLV